MSGFRQIKRPVELKPENSDVQTDVRPQISLVKRSPSQGRDFSLNLELLGRINPNFRLSFVHLDSASDFDVLTFDAGQDW